MNVGFAQIWAKSSSYLGKVLQSSRIAAYNGRIKACNLCFSQSHPHFDSAHKPVEISINDCVKSSHRGPCVTSGWIKTARHQSKHSFINLVDGLSHQHLQVVLPAGLRKNVNRLSYGASVKVSGVLIDSPTKGQAVELQADEISVLGDNDKENYPFAANARSYSSEYVRQYLHLRARVPEFAAMLRLRSACKKSIHDYFHNKDYVQIDTPILTTNDCEGAGDTFTVGSSKISQKNELYFGNRNVNLTVSGQLHLEACNSGISKVYTFGPTFRADNAVDRTHLAEFYMLEGEIAFINKVEELLVCVEDFTKTILSDILENKQADIHSLQQGSTRYEDTDVSKYLSKPFHRLPYADAVKLLESSSREFNKRPVFGQDLRREHEHYILEAHGNIPVFIIDWPKELKPFYMHLNDDNETVACMDLIVPGPGELFGGSIRESRYDMLKEVLEDRRMIDEYQWYLDIRRFGSVPHCGFGMGFERFLQFLLGVKQIRDTIPFPRYASNCRL